MVQLFFFPDSTHNISRSIYKIYKRVRLPDVVIHFGYNNRESANVIETLFNQILNRLSHFDSHIGNMICSHLVHARSRTFNRSSQVIQRFFSIFSSVRHFIN